MMTRHSGPHDNEEFLRQGQRYNSTFAESIPRWASQSNLATLISGEVQAVGVPLQIGDTAASITFVTGATHAVGVTAGFVALYSCDPIPVLLHQSDDWGSFTFDANTPYTFTLPPHTVDTPGVYYVAISFTATTVPTLRGTTLQNAVMAGDLGLGEAVLAMNAGSGVGGVAPATLEIHTLSASIPYVVVS